MTTQLTKLEMVQEFHRLTGTPGSLIPTLPSTEKRTLRKKLLIEEHEEYLEGEDNDDIVEIADALGDQLYIIYGTADEYGIPIDEVFAEIHRSNMSKMGEDGLPMRRADGKIIKGPNYSPPDLKSIIERAAARRSS